MATLRDPFFAPNTVSIDEMQQLQDADKGSLRRGWEAGRIGSERNALGIDEVAARAAGDIQRAETLRMQNDALGQAQARVAPEVQRVEDINSIGTGLNWFGGAVGQGLASTAEPVAAATALGGIGRVAGMLPGTAGKVGRAIGTVGAPAAAFGINQRQMAGEFANTAMQDQELMARTSPQDLHQTANLYGAGAGLLDTALPAIIGRQLTGAGLRAGMKAMGAGMGPATKTALGMLGEGTTEYSQGKGSQLVQGMLNPNRDTIGDASDDLNNFAGGMAGGGPLIAAGAYADAGYRRVGQAADMVGTKTGEMIDLAKEKYDGSALQGGVDKAMAAGKQKAGDMVDLLDHVRGDDGKVSLTKMADLVEGARDSANDLVQRYKVSDEERDLLNLTPPAGIAEDQAEHDAWLAQADDQRLQFVGGRLNDMAEADPRAADILDRMAAAQSRDEQVTIADEGAKLILETNEIEQLASRGERAAAAMGEMASKGASALGKGAVAVGKGAMKFGKAVFDGAAAEARKKNAQGEDYAAQGYEAWQERTGRAATDRVVQGAKNSPAAAQAKRRGDLFGEMLATETRAAMAKRGYAGKRADNIVALMQDAGYDIAHMSSKGGPSGANAALTIARTADTLRTALGPRAESVVDELRALTDPKAAKMFDQLRVAVETSRTPYGQKQLQQMRTAAANQLMAILPTEDMQELLQSEAAGGKLTRNWLLETVEGLANGHESPALRKALTEKFGETALNEMLAVVGETVPAPGKLMKGTVNDGGLQGEAGVNDDGEYEAELAPDSDFDKRQNEKKVEKGAGPKVYGFAKTGSQSLRGSTDRRDPFSPLTRASKGATPDRPQLFKLTDTLFEGGNALEKKIADMGAATEKTGHHVRAQSALEVMQDLKFQPGKIMSVYRDYLTQDAEKKGLDPAEKSALLDKAARVAAATLDAVEQGGVRKVFRTPAGERKQLLADAEAYFKERYVAVAEQLSDAVPDRLELTELLNMGRAGARVISVARNDGAKAAKKALESGSTEAQAEGVGKDAEHAVLDDANLITFQSDLLKNKDRGLHIKADTLVNWVRAQRARNETKADAKEDNSNRAKNQAYLDDLLEGITAVTTSGMVDNRMPTRINAKGEYESFTKGIPPSLRLVTSTYGNMQYGKEERTKARPKAEGPPKPESDPTSDQYQGAVDRDQAKNEEFFVMDPLEGLEPEPTYTSVAEPKMFVSPNADRARRTTTYADRPTFSTGSRARKGSELAGSKKERDALEAQYEEERKAREERSDAAGKSAGESPEQRDARRARLAESERSRVAERSVQSAARARALGTKDAKSDGDGVAPLDFFPRQKAGAVPDEFADQQFRTTKKAADVDVGPENKMSAMAEAPARGEAIARALRNDFAAGVAMIESRLRSAQRPEFIADKKARETSAVGGQHYVMPLAYALNLDTISKLDLGPAEAKKLTALRGEAAKIILLADKLKENQKVALTKAMAPATSADKVNLANYAKLLQKASEPATPAPAPAPASGTGLLAKTLKARLEYLNNPPAGYTTAKAREIDTWAKRQLERINEAIKGVDESSERYEALDEARFTAKQLVKKAASVLEGDASLADFEGSAAPEVAAAGAPKSQPKPSGAGFKLTPRGPFTPKDQLKANQATAFIGRGSAGSSTNAYAADAAKAGVPVNPGKYSASDVVFVSAEGARGGRVAPSTKELDAAMAAGATIVTDTPTHRAREYNVGEREAAAHLSKSGYVERRPGEWGRPGAMAGRIGQTADFYADEILDGLDQKDTSARSAAIQAIINGAHAAHARKQTKEDYLMSDEFGEHLAGLLGDVLTSARGSEAALSQAIMLVDQAFAQPVAPMLDKRIKARLNKGSATLGDLMGLYKGSTLPAATQVIAKAVGQVAGGITVRGAGHLKGIGLTSTEGVYGVYRLERDDIMMLRTAPNMPAGLLHEGVHAATAAGLTADADLHRAAYALMAHIAKASPRVARAYGMTNVLEFMAEGMSNLEFQKELKKIPASPVVAKYLGETLANAWDAFVGLVRKALNLAPEHQSALTQMLDLSGRAMKAQATEQHSGADMATLAGRQFVPTIKFRATLKQLRASGALEEDAMSWLEGIIEPELANKRGNHASAMVLAMLSRVTPQIASRSGHPITQEHLERLAESLASLGPALLPSAMSSEIHNDLERGGFAATHDSPIRHEGKFNWREHTGKGEGNAAFGAGTYLSTGDKVHNFYKKMMTEKVRGSGKALEAAYNITSGYAAEQEIVDAVRDLGPNATIEDAREAAVEVMKQEPGYDDEDGDGVPRQIARRIQSGRVDEHLRTIISEKIDPDAKSPTYHVSVNAMKAQLLNWDKPLSEQSSYVKKRLEGVVPNDPWGNDDMAALIAGVSDGSSVRIDPAYLRGEGNRFLVRHDGKVVGYFVTEAEAKNGARQALAGQGLTLVASPTGREIYRALTARLGSQAAASDYLQNLGILGHEYAASNGRDGKTPNYVIYDDSKITTNYVHFNRQGGNARVASQAEMDEAKAYVRKVLGPQIKVEFKDITGYAGEWLDAEQAIQISTTAAPGVLHTAYHEALHGFFSKFVKSDPRALDVLRSLAENDKILARVAALLAGHPAAIDQLKSGEERLAYIYQFWAAGKLDLPMGKPRTMLQKVRKFFRRVLGLVKDSERAVALFEAFHGGQLAEPSAAGKVIARVLDEGTGVLKARRSMDGLTQWLAAKTMPAETVLATSESKAARALAKEFFTNPGDETAGKEAEGYLNARRRVAARYNNTFAQAIRGLSDRDLTEVAKLLQDEAELADIPYAPHREAVGKIRGLLQRFYKYMSDERGLELGHAGDKYFPRVWNTHLLHEKKDQFVQMLATHYDAVLEQGAQGSKGKLSKEQVAERIWRALVDREGVNDKLDAQRQDGVLAPFFASKENRTLAWLSGEHAQPFLEKNLVATLSRYFHQGVRAAEYTDRFGADGAELEAKLMEIQGELTELSMAKLQRKEFKDDAARAKWVSRQYRDVAEAVGAMEGTLGKDVSPTVRKLNSWVTVYQNVRLLPLSLFASFVDPLGMVARGATMKEAYDAFLRGAKEVVTNWGDMFREEPKERQADQWEKLAEHVGAVDAALFAHHVSDEYSSVYMERGAKTINDTMFKLNGMEAWNRGMRVAGVKSAVAFIERHAGGADKIHSTRWLEELGLDPKNIPLDTEGKLITDKSVLMQQKGMGKSQAEREIDAVHYAINRWVEGAILTPNAAQRPAWGSDPHYSMFFHLKQFSYSFHQTILKRAVKEMNHGNLAPMGAFVWYIPTMIAADITKGLIQGGGELPAYMKGYDAGDWMMHGVQRAGLLGAGQIGVDAGEDMFSLAGPGVEQMIDAMRDPLSETTIKALPAHGIYAQALR